MVVPVMWFCGVPGFAAGTGLAAAVALPPEPAAAPPDAVAAAPTGLPQLGQNCEG